MTSLLQQLAQWNKRPPPLVRPAINLHAPGQGPAASQPRIPRPSISSRYAARPNFLFGYFNFGQAKKKYLVVTGETVIQPTPYLPIPAKHPLPTSIPLNYGKIPLNPGNPPPQHTESTNTATVTATPPRFQPTNASRPPPAHKTLSACSTYCSCSSNIAK